MRALGPIALHDTAMAVVEPLILGTSAFVSTNVDDILLLALFFSQPGRRVGAIVLGQYLGIGALVGISVVAALAAVVVPAGWIRLLGLAPCALGVQRLLARDDSHTIETPRGLGVLAVTSITMANGGDNLGVYIPMFAIRQDAVPTYVVVFAVGTGLWCWLGYWAVSHPEAGAVLTRYGHRILPWVLIAIGLHVLSGLWQ